MSGVYAVLRPMLVSESAFLPGAVEGFVCVESLNHGDFEELVVSTTVAIAAAAATGVGDAAAPTCGGGKTAAALVALTYLHTPE